MKLQALILAAIATGAVAPQPVPEGEVAEGGDCTVYFNANANGGQGSWKKYHGQADTAVMCSPLASDESPLSCIPVDTSSIGDANGWQDLAGKCKKSTCEGYDETDGITVGNIPSGEAPGTRRVTICHRTCSTNNPWVRITIDYHAFEADNGVCTEDGNDHTRHDVEQDCSGYNGDYSEWGGVHTEDYLIRYHGSRADLASNFTNDGTYDGFTSEEDYWSYWERACPSVRANKGANSCCFGDECCGYAPSTEPQVEPVTPNTPASEIVSTSGSNGDPHFKTWANEHFEYHGQCDLVLTKDESFADGLGLDIQLRTKLVRYWSYIRSAAIRIGLDIIELEGSSDPQDQSIRYWYNMQFKSDEAKTMSGFPMTIRRVHSQMTKIEIDLSSKYPGVKIVMSTFKEFVKVEVEGATEEAFANTVGLLGDFNTGKTLARDGKTNMHDFIEYGHEWQVTPMEDMLFHSTEEPQFPSKCLEPEDPRGDRRRRLAESNITMEQAESACDRLKDPLDRRDCVYDILATQDLDMIGAF